MTVLQRLVLALGSATLLVISFPNFNQSWCVWIALVPWLRLLARASARAAWWWSYAIGTGFFLGSMWWLTKVTVLGYVICSAYLGLYLGAFGALARWVLAREPPGVMRWLLLPSLWVALEYARSHLLTGLAWNLLGYALAGWVPLIQVADVTGVWGVSWLAVFVNVALAEGVGAARHRVAALGAIIGLLSFTWAYGVWRMPQALGTGHIRVALIQGNIPQDEKWEEAYADRILARYEELTRQAARTGPALIVWPETSVPGYLGVDEALTQRLLALGRAAEAPLLVGTPVPRLAGTRVRLMNSAQLISAQGELGTRYDKLHLVPFGEYVPFEEQAPWLRDVLPPIGDFSPGHDDTVFRPEPVPPFSVLICFEDIFPHLARRFVREGATWLLTITNDAWFGPTAAAYQHAQTSTLRAVELRIPMARAANTGWSGCIDPAGRWLSSVRDPHGTELFVPGTVTCELPQGTAQSLYRRWGDWFALLALLGSLGWSGRRWLRQARGAAS